MTCARSLWPKPRAVPICRTRPSSRPPPLETSMKILIVTDAWHPQVNGVVRTLGQVAQEAPALGSQVTFLTPDEFRTFPMPSYPEIRLSLVLPRMIERRLNAAMPAAIHIGTEGALGQATRRSCLPCGLPFTTGFHTRFPDYVADRVPFGRRWSSELTWAWLGRVYRTPHTRQGGGARRA